MGWAARAQVRSGNPVEPEIKVRSLDSRKHAKIFRGRVSDPMFSTAVFSDRTYLVDRHGTLRRAPVDLQPRPPAGEPKLDPS